MASTVLPHAVFIIRFTAGGREVAAGWAVEETLGCCEADGEREGCEEERGLHFDVLVVR